MPKLTLPPKSGLFGGLVWLFGTQNFQSSLSTHEEQKQGVVRLAAVMKQTCSGPVDSERRRKGSRDNCSESQYKAIMPNVSTTLYYIYIGEWVSDWGLCIPDYVALIL